MSRYFFLYNHRLRRISTHPTQEPRRNGAEISKKRYSLPGAQHLLQIDCIGPRSSRARLPVVSSSSLRTSGGKEFMVGWRWRISGAGAAAAVGADGVAVWPG